MHSQVGVALYRITSGKGPWAGVKVFGKQGVDIVIEDNGTEDAGI